jgi:CheY-like chemotaxis protein
MDRNTPTGKRILVVDDDADIREALVCTLQAGGYRADGAGNGREALDQLRRDDRPQLILLDLMMPVMDGWQFRQAQRQDPDLAPIPVVIISADIQNRAAYLGAADYLRKPFDWDNLLATVERYSD